MQPSSADMMETRGESAGEAFPPPGRRDFGFRSDIRSLEGQRRIRDDPGSLDKCGSGNVLINSRDASGPGEFPHDGTVLPDTEPSGEMGGGQRQKSDGLDAREGCNGGVVGESRIGRPSQQVNLAPSASHMGRTLPGTSQQEDIKPPRIRDPRTSRRTSSTIILLTSYHIRP
ncbi:hypothetical protein VTI74DRAFT_1771 [Chaetomium olivicolor]